jgi:hypothetical protein
MLCRERSATVVAKGKTVHEPTIRIVSPPTQPMTKREAIGGRQLVDRRCMSKGEIGRDEAEPLRPSAGECTGLRFSCSNIANH